MKIDIFNHVMPTRYLDMMKEHLKDQGILKRMSNLRMLWDIEARVRMLDEKFPDVQQVLTLSLPSPELVGAPELAPDSRASPHAAGPARRRNGRRNCPHSTAPRPRTNFPPR